MQISKKNSMDDNCTSTGTGTCIIPIDAVLEGFAYPCETRYADFASVYSTPHLKTVFCLHCRDQDIRTVLDAEALMYKQIEEVK